MIFEFEQLQGGDYEKVGEDPDAFLGDKNGSTTSRCCFGGWMIGFFLGDGL